MDQSFAIKRDARITREQIQRLHEEANRRALRVRRIRTGILIGLNVVMAVIILLPLLYAVSVAFMPSSELFTTELNLFPANPTGEKFCPWPL